MYFQTSYFLVLIVTFDIQMVYSNVTLSAPKSSYVCQALKLRCQYIGVSSCCRNLLRVWKQNGIEIMNGGVESSTAGKYSEFIDDTADYFELTIQNVVGSDFGEKYVCEYGFDSSELTLETELICYPCYICGLICLGYALAAMPIGLFLSSLFYWLGFTCFKSYWSIRKYFCIAFDENAAGNYSKLYGEEFSNKRRRKALIIAIPVTIGGYVVVYGLVFAFWIFGLQCPSCEGSTELAVLSFGVGGLGFLFIFYMALKFQRDAKCSCKDWCFFAVIVPFIFVIVGIIFMFLYLHFCLKDLIESIETTIGETVRLICPYQAESGEIKWIKLNGNVRETYSDGTAISQDLPRNLRDRLKVDSKDLCISNVQASDAGIYECVLFPKPNKVPQCSKLNLIVSGGE